MITTPVKCVVFDIGNVVWRFLPLYDQVLTLWAARLGQTLTQFRTDHYNVDYHGFEVGTLTLDSWFGRIAPGLDPALFKADLDSVFGNDSAFTSHLNQDVIRLISHLRRHSQPVGCLSNTEYFVYPYLKRHIEPLFDFSILSWQVGLRKPEPAIYHHIFKFGDWLPSQVLFIDDKPENIATAQTVGLQTIHYRDPSSLDSVSHLAF